MDDITDIISAFCNQLVNHFMVTGDLLLDFHFRRCFAFDAQPTKQKEKHSESERERKNNHGINAFININVAYRLNLLMSHLLTALLFVRFGWNPARISINSHFYETEVVLCDEFTGMSDYS